MQLSKSINRRRGRVWKLRFCITKLLLILPYKRHLGKILHTLLLSSVTCKAFRGELRDENPDFAKRDFVGKDFEKRGCFIEDIEGHWIQLFWGCTALRSWGCLGLSWTSQNSSTLISIVFVPYVPKYVFYHFQAQGRRWYEMLWWRHWNLTMWPFLLSNAVTYAICTTETRLSSLLLSLQGLGNVLPLSSLLMRLIQCLGTKWQSNSIVE